MAHAPDPDRPRALPPREPLAPRESKPKPDRPRPEHPRPREPVDPKLHPER